MLKQYATFHLHPENPVVTTDPYAKGRNFFDRASAPKVETWEEMEERVQILEEARMLKMYASFHMHPEKPVVTADATACARNYFTRVSAPEQETFEDSEERSKILKEAAILKKYAEFHLHPEKPIETTDGTVFGRNYFTRASAPEQESLDEMEERVKVLEEAAMLKQYAEFHLHPEKPVKTTDATACGRNYYTRASAPEYFDEDDAEERERILSECAALKQYAEFHLHPEKPIETTDGTVFGRNYFMRASAPEQESLDEMEERVKILEEVAMLKQYAEFHLHPEKPVKTTDPAARGRLYYHRPSAPYHNLISSQGRACSVVEYIDDGYDHHFAFDEELLDFDDLRVSLTRCISAKLADSIPALGGEKEEGNLSRSPSTIMLFEYGHSQGQENEAY